VRHLRKDHMKYLISLLLILGSWASASADSRHTVVATVPFDFVVGGQTLPAGTYCISQIFSDGTSLLSVQRTDGRADGYIFRVVTDPGSGHADHVEPRMLFEHTGSTYFLTTIISDDRSYNFARQRPSAGVPDPASTVVTSFEQ
jgi:hypothetical protein